MSASSLPEWKQLLLDKKKREEEERERREKEEEEKLASMPAWKRGIIQRRKAKQESLGDKDREKETEAILLSAEVRSPSDGLSDTDSSLTANLGSEPSLSPDPGQWLDSDTTQPSQVSVETIVPVHENPFIRTQSAWRKDRDAEKAADGGYPEGGSELEVEVENVWEKEKDKLNPRGHDGELGKGRNVELKIERFRDMSEGRVRDRDSDRSQGRGSKIYMNRNEGRKKDKLGMKEREFLKIGRDNNMKDPEPSSPLLAPLVPCQTIRANNIIIIEQDRRGSDERWRRWRDTEKERAEEANQEKRGVKMELREILAGGGSITEIQASEVLIIKPPASPEEMHAGGGGGGGGGKGREDAEMKCTMDGGQDSMGREHRSDMAWLREKEREIVKAKERPWGQATVIKEDRKDGFADRGGRVSQLLSKFGEHPKPPFRSKSSDNFLKISIRDHSGDRDDRQSQERMPEEKDTLLKGVPKRSFSFSERVLCAKDNGVDERKTRERLSSDRSAEGKETKAKICLNCTQLPNKDRFGKHRDAKNDIYDTFVLQHRSSTSSEAHVCIQHRIETSTVEPVGKRAVEKAGDEDVDEGFTVASVKNTEGIAFARRVQIRQDGKARDGRRPTEDGEKTLEMEQNEKEAVCSKTRPSEVWRDERLESETPDETVQENHVMAASVDSTDPCRAAESHYRHESAFNECSGPPCAAAERPRDAQKGTEWSGTSPQGSYQTPSQLSQQTQDLISKIERIGGTTVFCNVTGERSYRGTSEISKESEHDAHISNHDSENLSHDTKGNAPVGIVSSPLEIQIPRTVFYVAEELSESKEVSDQSDEGWEGGKAVQRRDSWRIGKPLSRIESLREKIRQKELERLRLTAQDGDVSDEADVTAAQTAGDTCEEEETEKETEWEAAEQMRKRLVEAERGQEGLTVQAAAAAFDVTQEVAVLKTCPQLPVSVPFAQAARGEEVTSGYTLAEVISDSFQISDDEDDPLKRVEEQLSGCGRELSGTEGEEREKEEEDMSEEDEEEEEYTSHISPSQSLCPSPPHLDSLTAMSWIYNLETVCSRSGLFVRERNVDVPSVHLVKVKPLMSHAHQETRGKHGDNTARSDDDVRGVQHQMEQFQLKEQEVKSTNGAYTQTKTLLREGETKGQQGPKGETKGQLGPRGQSRQQVQMTDVKIQQKDPQKSEWSSRFSSQRVYSPTCPPKQAQPTQSTTVTVTPTSLRSQSPENSPKPSAFAPTPAPSPLSLSPVESPSVSPTPTLFTIRSASGGQVKRGATITITPKKAAGAGERAFTPAGPSTTKAQTPPAIAEPEKRKYPTVEEIEVIGGYQNLGKSCLVKKRGRRKKVKVCFDKVQLERVCEYPSETFMLADKVQLEQVCEYPSKTSMLADKVQLEQVCEYPSKTSMLADKVQLEQVCEYPSETSMLADKVQLEQVCEYPSETSMLACTPYPPDLGVDERPGGDREQEEEAEEAQAAILSKTTKNVGSTTGRVFRVGQCHPLRKKHNV